MPLLLLDLDNTLLPRDAAFRAWARDFLSERGLPPGDLDWFTTIDGSGYVPRSTVLSAAQRRYGLDESIELLLAHYRRGINSHIHCPPRHIDALRAARAAGWTIGIVSNGNTRPQLEKIRRTGLGPLVDGWVISEEADCLKPDPLIFAIAAQRCGVSPTGDWASQTWMIGDHAPADIAGAELTGLRSVWLHHGRPWSELGYRPTLKAAGLPEAVGQVLSARSAPSGRPGIRAGGPGVRRSAPGAARRGGPDHRRTAEAEPALPHTLRRAPAAGQPAQFTKGTHFVGGTQFVEGALAQAVGGPLTRAAQPAAPAQTSPAAAGVGRGAQSGARPLLTALEAGNAPAVAHAAGGGAGGGSGELPARTGVRNPPATVAALPSGAAVDGERPARTRFAAPPAGLSPTAIAQAR